MPFPHSGFAIFKIVTGTAHASDHVMAGNA
jgi:hypothetical protein